jgi:nitrite reductase (NADH) small subunit
MQEITLALDSFNFISVAERRYFLLQDREIWIVPSECPHRGGPLHLGTYSPCKARLVCPWHNNSYAKGRITGRALPTICRRSEVSIVVPKGEVRAWKELLVVNSGINQSNKG